MDISAFISLLTQRSTPPQPAPFLRAQLDANVVVVLRLAHVGGVGLWLARRSSLAQSLQPAPVRLTTLTHAADDIAYAIEDSVSTAHDDVACVLRDASVRALTAVLGSSLEQPLDADVLFVELTIAALRARVDALLPLQKSAALRHGLAPWQERRARELLLAHLAETPVLSEIAQACRLSLSHFKRAFRRSTGVPPHRWLLERRVERSKQLMIESPTRTLADIALECGFGDQAHFTRTFARLAGATPGTWRRACGVPA